MKSINEFLGMGGGTYIGKLAKKDDIPNEDWDALGVYGQQAYGTLRMDAIRELRNNAEKYGAYDNEAEILKDVLNAVFAELNLDERFEIV